MVAASPLGDLPAGSQQNPDRSFYVSQAVIVALLEKCPGVFWRLVIALGWDAGLRILSEVASLTWDDVAWDTGRLTVRSPKTSRHDGHAVRIVPICPELRTILAEAYEQAPEGTKLILPRALMAASNLRTTFTKIIMRSRCHQQGFARTTTTRRKPRARAKRRESLRAEEGSLSGRRGTRTPNPLGVNEVL